MCSSDPRGGPTHTPSCSGPTGPMGQSRPSRAHLEDVKREPLTEPKQDRPTKTGMIQDMTPKW